MTQRSRIFISYSHKDRDRADFLWEELRSRGHEVHIDRDGIFETEHITTRIRDMMQGSDVVVLVLGPNWITSPACRMEMQFALELNKRMVPAAFEDVGPDLPPEIREINYVRFYGENGDWAQAIERLDSALDRDIEWIRDHTRFGEQAARFLAGVGAPPRGAELRAIRRWIERHPRGAPGPTRDHWRYFKAGMSRRKWFQIGSAVATTVAICAAMVGGYFWVSNQQCEELRSRAREAQTLDPVLAIQNILPLIDFSFCRAPDAWLEVLETLGQTIQGQRLRATVTLPDAPAHFVEFLPGSGHVVTVSSDGSAAVFDPETGAVIEGEVAMPAAGVAPRILYDRGRFLLIRDSRVTVWDPREGVISGLPYQGGERVLSAALSPGGDTLVVASASNELHFHSLISGRALRDTLRLGDDVTALAFVPGSARLIASVGDEVRVIDLVPALNGRAMGLIHRLRMPGPVVAMDVSADGSTVAAATGNITGVWDLTTFDAILPPSALYLDGVDILGLGLSPDGLRLAVGASDNRARIHDVPTGKSLITLLGHRSPVRDVHFSPRGNAVMTHDEAGVMRLFDVSTGHSVPSISDAMTEAVVSTSDAGRNAAAMELMATGLRINILPNQPGVLRLTHVAEDAPPFYNERLAHDGFVTSMALSPDERLLVTGADDGQVYVWDAQTGLPLYTFAHARDGLVTYVAADFTPSGDHIISWDSNGEQRVWAIQPLTGDLFQTACRLLPFENGVRDVAGLIGDIATRDPCEDVVLLPRWGATLWLASR
jgi:WD40 repeat protein